MKKKDRRRQTKRFNWAPAFDAVHTASAAVKEKPPDACSSGGKMQEAPTPCVSVSEFDYRAPGKSRNQKSQPRLLRTFQNSLNLGQSALNKDSKQPQNTTQNYPELTRRLFVFLGDYQAFSRAFCIVSFKESFDYARLRSRGRIYSKRALLVRL